jgi:intergrase/recombinase
MKKQIKREKYILSQMIKNLKTSIEQGSRTHTQQVLLVMILTGSRMSEAIKLVESGSLAKIYNRQR